MKTPRALLSLCFIAACSPEEPLAPDPIEIGDGKSDSGGYTTCQVTAVRNFLDETATDATRLAQLGVDPSEADAIRAGRPAAASTWATLVAATEARCRGAFAMVWDVDRVSVRFAPDDQVPDDLMDVFGDVFSLWDLGGPRSDAGKRCAYASAFRFQSIMTDPPEALLRLTMETSWVGAFESQNLDDTLGQDNEFYGPGLGAFVEVPSWWSVTTQDGTCYLPTRELVIRWAEKCLPFAATRGGSIVGCVLDQTGPFFE